MLKQVLIAFLPLAALVALPLALRPRGVVANFAPGPAERLVIVTPHNETIRYEFERAFVAHCRDVLGRRVAIEWRLPGGTADIVRYVDDQFAANFRRYWEAAPERGTWTREVAAGFTDARWDGAGVDSGPGRVARRLFLESAVGIGCDLLFGGGQYDISRLAQKGYAVDAGVRQRHPEWLDPEILPPRCGGEIFYDPDGRYYGVCLSSFGICVNPELSERLGVAMPAAWADLGRPELRDWVVVADPTKSGSINKCFELLVQQQMVEAIGRHGGRTPAALDEGWQEGLCLLRRIGANARTITDSASKVPRDVARGEAAAGMCIDFYGRAEAEWAERQSGNTRRLRFVAPRGGTVLTADPIMIFRGAPNRELAEAFVDFVLSESGQRLWNFRPGTPGGPERHALRRLPVRRDMYGPAERRQMSDPDAEPYAQEAGFSYDPSLTARYFSLVRVLFRCMVIEPWPELREAWSAITAAGGPEACPAAMAALARLPFTYGEAGTAVTALDPHAPGNSQLLGLRRQREWTEFFREQYRQARQLAQEGR